jgi:tetratricopeptide (TPR) repeat protein
MVGAVVGVLALVLAATVWAEGTVPWQPGAASTPAAPTEATMTVTETPPAPAVNPKFEKMATPVKEMVTQAEKLLKQAEDEMAKPEDKRDAKKALAMKTNAARLYLNAAQKAKMGSALLTKADEKQAFLDQYEKPNRDKAVSMILELADAARAKKDYTQAVSLYKQVLTIDPKNSTAEAAIKAIAEEMKTAAQAGTKGGTGGGSSQIKDYQKDYKTDYSGHSKTNWAR